MKFTFKPSISPPQLLLTYQHFLARSDIQNSEQSVLKTRLIPLFHIRKR